MHALDEAVEDAKKTLQDRAETDLVDTQDALDSIGEILRGANEACERGLSGAFADSAHDLAKASARLSRLADELARV